MSYSPVQGDYAYYKHATDTAFDYSTDQVSIVGASVITDNSSAWISNYGAVSPGVTADGIYSIVGHIKDPTGTVQITLYDSSGSPLAPPWGEVDNLLSNLMRVTATLRVAAGTHVDMTYNSSLGGAEVAALIIQRVA